MDPKKKGIQPIEMGNPTKEEDLYYLQQCHLYKVSKCTKIQLAN